MTTVIDAHCHLYRTAEDGQRAKDSYSLWEYGSGGDPTFTTAAGDPAQTLAAMDAAGVDIAVVANLLEEPVSGKPVSDQLLSANEWLLRTAAVEPRFIPFVAADQRYLSIADLVDHLRDIRSRVRSFGIKIHPPVQRMHVSDEQYWPVFAYCEAEAIPILAHSGPSQDGAPYGEPDSYRPLLATFPGLPIWLAHLGGANWEQAMPLASDHPSVHFDLCEIIEWVGASRAPTLEQLSSVVRAIGPDRIMMGSDFPWYDIASAIRRVNDLPSMNEEQKARVLGGTAAQFLGLTSAA